MLITNDSLRAIAILVCLCGFTSRSMGDIRLSSSVTLDSPATVSNPSLFNLGYEGGGITVVSNGQQQPTFNYRISALQTSQDQPSVVADYTSSTTITNTSNNQTLGVLVVKGKGIGSYFTDNRVRIG